MAHIPLFIFDSEPDAHTIFTVLREPRARVISFLNHIASEEHHHAHPFFVGGPLSWEDVFTRFPFCFEAFDLQTRMLGVEPEAALWERACAGNLTAAYAAFGDFTSKSVNDEHLEAAIEAATGRVEACLFECLDFACGTTLAPLFADPTQRLPHLRKPAHRLAFGDEVLEKLDIHNAFDRRLYERARTVLLERAARTVVERQELIALAAPPTPSRAFTGLNDIRASSCVGPMAKRVFASVRHRNSGRLDLRIEAWPNDACDVDKVTVVVNQQRIERDTSEAGLTWRCQAEAEGHARGFGLDVLVLSDTRKFSGDPRTLGIPLRSLRMR